MRTTSIDPTHHSRLLHRVFDLPRCGLNPDRARWLLELDFPDVDHTRIASLNQKANEGVLSEEEQAELEAYVSIADLLAYWQSQARQHLKEGSSGANQQ